MKDKVSTTEAFLQYAKHVLVEPRNEPTVERLVKFLAKYVGKIASEESTLDLFNKVVRFLLSVSGSLEDSYVM